MTRFVAMDSTPTLHGQKLPVKLIYVETDPYAVTLRFDPNDSDKDWTFARAILADAISFQPPESTDGDVLAAREADDFALTLGASTSPATLRFPTVEVQAFLARTFALVPYGLESNAVDWRRAEEVFSLPPGSLTPKDRS